MSGAAAVAGIPPKYDLALVERVILEEAMNYTLSA